MGLLHNDCIISSFGSKYSTRSGQHLDGWLAVKRRTGEYVQDILDTDLVYPS